MRRIANVNVVDGERGRADLDVNQKPLATDDSIAYQCGDAPTGTERGNRNA
jgi:hypothetical protein